MDPLTLCTASLALGLNLGTYHLNRNRDFQEINPGLYAQCEASPGIHGIIGAYYNSNRKLSLHAGRVFPLENGFALNLELVTGYDRAPILPLVALSWKHSPSGLRFTLIPPVDKNTGALHLSWEF
jgi:hypothetical protein